jgi:hypothetical protein
MTQVFCCSFSCGVINAQSHWSAGAGTPTIITTGALHGDRSLECVSAAAATWAQSVATVSGSGILVARAYVRFPTSLPDGNVQVFGALTGGTFEPMVFTAYADGAVINSYTTITPILTDGTGTVLAQPGTAVKLTQTGSNIGKFTWTPHAQSFTRSSTAVARMPEKFGIRFSILDVGSALEFFPGGAADIIPVHPR